MPTTVISTLRPPAISLGKTMAPAGASVAAGATVSVGAAVAGTSVSTTGTSVGTGAAVGVAGVPHALRTNAASRAKLQSRTNDLIFMVIYYSF
jgi:ABC-type Na+ efflux pump permease subunit